MTTCLLCHREIAAPLTLWQLINFQPITEQIVCTRCRQAFSAIDPQLGCQSCGRLSNQKKCSDCERWSSEIEFSNRACYTYNTAMKAYMSQYKFNGDYRLRTVFQLEIQREIQASKCDVVVPIPLHPDTLAARGFNQVEGLIGELPMLRALTTISATKAQHQSAKNRKQRLTTAQPFKLAVDSMQLYRKNVLIVDDVYTTGRTIRYAAFLLKKAGATTVKELTLAHG